MPKFLVRTVKEIMTTYQIEAATAAESKQKWETTSWAYTPKWQETLKGEQVLFVTGPDGKTYERQDELKNDG